MKDWREMQPELDRSREVITQAVTDYFVWKETNPYQVGTRDWELYELGRREAVLDEFTADFVAEKNRLQARINELETENAELEAENVMLDKKLKKLGGGR